MLGEVYSSNRDEIYDNENTKRKSRYEDTLIKFLGYIWSDNILTYALS